MYLTGAPYKEAVAKILRGTEEGPITQWTERMAQVAKKIGLPVQHINWNGTPSTVAGLIAEYANDCGYLAALFAELESK